jgi:RND superfamily putative drug exporter
MFKALGDFLSRHSLLVIVCWLVAATAIHLVAPSWSQVAKDGDLAYLPANMPSRLGEALLHDAFPAEKAKSSVALVVARHDQPLQRADLDWADHLSDLCERETRDLPVLEIWNHNSEVVGEKLTSKPGKQQPGQATVVLLLVSNEFAQIDNIRLLKRIQDLVAQAKEAYPFPAGLDVGITGSAALGGDFLASSEESIKNTEVTTIALVVCILLLVYRAPVLVALPLATIGLSLLIATDVLALLTLVNQLPGFDWWNFKIFTTTKIFIVVILFGAGTDFCLFLISRFKEELDNGLAPRAAVAESITQVGEALVGSALTTICGLGMLFFSDFGKFRNSGPAIALSLAITLLACLTFAPALLTMAGNALFWPFASRRARLAAERGTVEGQRRMLLGRFWETVSGVVIAHPGLILIVSILALAPLARVGWGIKVTYDLVNELDPRRPSVQGVRLSQEFFPPGETSPVTILALQENGKFNSPEGEREIARLTKSLYDIDGVVSVRSIAEPLGNKPGYTQLFRAGSLKKIAARKHKRTTAVYLTQVPGLLGNVARFEVVTREEPFSQEAIDLVDRIDDQLRALGKDAGGPWHETQFYLVGTTAGVRDLQIVTQSDQTLIQRLTVIAVLAVLIFILRRPLICFYLIASVLFSYYVTIGAAELYFSWLYGDTFRGLDWKVPIFLFVILIAVGEDYNIYLVTRVFEEQERHGLIEGLRRAVACTGGIITSCGVIMAGTFISMMSGTLRGMLELGFALSLGVMLDTCVVRPVLVPAFMALVYRIESRFRSPQASRGTLAAGAARADEALAEH